LNFIRNILLVLFLMLTLENWAQLNSSEKRMLKNANSYFEHEEFDKALPLFLKINEVTVDYSVKYRIGACYLNTIYYKLKAIAFFEEISKEESIEIPTIVHYDLGILFHYTYRFDEAIDQLSKFIQLSSQNENLDKANIANAKKTIGYCKNAIEITTVPFKAEIDVLRHPINTMESEYCPMITADEQTMVYMRAVGLGKLENPVTSIMISHKESGNIWGNPIPLTLENSVKYAKLSVSLAGLSPDGQTIFINIGIGLNQDIYSGAIKQSKIVEIKKLNKNINTNFYEGRVSISSDGTELYFVSDRPGGFGGTDIYKSIRNRRGDWGAPINLGEVINTQYNENSPFKHPDNVTIFFSSEGHKTIGGNDIFKSKIENGFWNEPENLGFPNSTKDDLYFALNANGQIGYFSTSKNNIYNKHNIFKVNLKDPIPLTLVKGVIKLGNPPKPGKVEIKVYDKETGLKVKYIYNPSPETGKYLMIFPPAKNYDLVISSGEFLPQLINVYIPYQTYFYELYQEILLEPINLQNNTIGEKITVNNTFYDLYKTYEADSILLDDLPKQPKYYDHLLELVENIIQTSDTMRINYASTDNLKQHEKNNVESLLNLIEQAIETSDPVTLSILDANTRQKDKIKETHFYVDGDKSKSLQMQIIGTDTIYTAPPIKSMSATSLLPASTLIKTEKPLVESNFKLSAPSKRNYIHKYVVYYDINKDKIPKSATKDLEDITQIIINNQAIGIEVSGFTDSQGEKRYNLSLSRKRAQKVLKYFIDNNIEQNKIIAKGFGEAEDHKSGNSDKQRRVEINVFELKQE
jgi:outer membrane protein OmpA-like peptidoglycan-associated protein